MADNESGLTLRGEFLSLKLGRPWKGKDGADHQPGVVAVLVGDRAFQVEYRDMDTAESEAGHLARGDTVELRVFARAKGKDWLTLSGRPAS